MPIISTKDGTGIFYKDWGEGTPIVFSHGWPLDADAWDEQLLWFAARGYRTIAHDRRGHGRSTQPWHGNDIDTYADDLAALIEQLDLRAAILVGHSTGGGEVVRYIRRHGTARVAKLALVGAVPPAMLKTAANPGGLPMAVFDDMRAAVTTNRSQFYRDVSAQFFNADAPGAAVPQGLRDQFWLQSMRVGLKAAVDCIAAFSETDFTSDLAAIDVPTLVLHGDADRIVPIDASAKQTAKLVAHATTRIYAGGDHMISVTQRDRFNEDLLGFLRT